MPEGKKPEEANKEPVKKEDPKKVEKVIQEPKKEPRKFQVHAKKAERVAICGFAPTSKDLAPYQDPQTEIWACNELYNYIPRLDVLFEMHSREEWGENFGSNHGPKHTEWLKQSKVPVYMCRHYEDIPMSVPYPWELIKGQYGGYFNNTISYMIVLALAMGYKWIGLFGIDMAHVTEYSGQRPSCEYFIGWAMGLKMLRGWPEVYIPAESDLLKTSLLYGYQSPGRLVSLLESKMQHFQRQHNTYAAQEQQIRDTKMHYLGAAQGLADFHRTLVHQ